MRNRRYHTLLLGLFLMLINNAFCTISSDSSTTGPNVYSNGDFSSTNVLNNIINLEYPNTIFVDKPDFINSTLDYVTTHPNAGQFTITNKTGELNNFPINTIAVEDSNDITNLMALFFVCDTSPLFEKTFNTNCFRETYLLTFDIINVIDSSVNTFEQGFSSPRIEVYANDIKILETESIPNNASWHHVEEVFELKDTSQFTLKFQSIADSCSIFVIDEIKLQKFYSLTAFERALPVITSNNTLENCFNDKTNNLLENTNFKSTDKEYISNPDFPNSLFLKATNITSSYNFVSSQPTVNEFTVVNSLENIYDTITLKPANMDEDFILLYALQDTGSLFKDSSDSYCIGANYEFSFEVLNLIDSVFYPAGNEAYPFCQLPQVPMLDVYINDHRLIETGHIVNNGIWNKYVVYFTLDSSYNNFSVEIKNATQIDEFSLVALKNVYVKRCNNKPELFVPNAFTPNGDLLNDQLEVFGKDYPNFKMKIYNKWGEIIFVTDNRNKLWNGEYLGEKAPTGQYPWLITFDDCNGDQISKSGTTLLIE